MTMPRRPNLTRHAALPVLMALPLAACASQPPPAPVAPQHGSATSLTIYSTAAPGSIPPEMYRPTPGPQNVYNPYQNQPIPGYAVVRHERPISLTQGRSTVRFSDVAAFIDPTTVAFTSLTDPAGTHVLEQNYQFDLVSTPKLLERYLDKTITIQQFRGPEIDSVTGTLLSTGGTGGGLILRTADHRIETLNSYSNILFPDLPEGLITKPTLVWDILTDKAGPQTARVSYQTTGITWWADYNVVFTEGKDANSGALDVGAWVSIINQSGATYPDARLKLIAGDVHRAPQANRSLYPAAEAAANGMRKESLGFEEKAFFEYHLYTLGRPTTLPENSTKQVELFPPVAAVPVEKILVYYGLPMTSSWFSPSPLTDRDLGTPTNTKVDIYLRFKNSQDHGMGMPLPSGRIRVSKLDPADQSLEFIGEDTLDHTPRDEQVLIKLGSAFDVVGERKQTDFKADFNAHWMEETIEIKVRNHKAEPVNVIVKENLYRWVNWKITKTTHEYEKQDSRTIHFPVRVEKDGETVVRYTVRYTW